MKFLLVFASLLAALAAWWLLLPSDSPTDAKDVERRSELPSSPEGLGTISSGEQRIATAAREQTETGTSSIEGNGSRGVQASGADVRRKTFRAIIQDRATGQPIEGARALPFSAISQPIVRDRVWETLAESGEDGVVHVKVSPTAETQVRSLTRREQQNSYVFDAPGYGITIAELSQEHAAPNPPRVVRLTVSASLSGRVTGAGPTSLAPVTIQLETYSRTLAQQDYDPISSNPVVWTCELESSGEFRIDDLPSGVDLRARVVADDRILRRIPERLNFEPGDVQRVDWSIGGGATVRVRAIEESGTPAVGVQIALDVPPEHDWKYANRLTDDARLGVTDEAGYVEFGDVGLGRWILVVTEEQPSLQGKDTTETTRRSRAPANAVHEVHITEPGSRVEASVTVHRGHYIVGRLLTWDGQPADGWIVARGGANGVTIGNSDASGDFRIGPILPGEYSLVGSGNRGGIPGEPLIARTGDDDVTIKLGRGSSIQGRIVDRDTGEPVAASTKYVPGDGSSWHGNTPGDPGRLSIDGIRPGPFALLIESKDGRRALHRSDGLAPGEVVKDLLIQLGERTYLDVHYGGDQVEVVAVIEQGGFRVGKESISRDAPALLPVPPGELDVAIHAAVDEGAPRVLHSEKVTVTEGTTLRVDIAE